MYSPSRESLLHLKYAGNMRIHNLLLTRWSVRHKLAQWFSRVKTEPLRDRENSDFCVSYLIRQFLKLYIISVLLFSTCI